MERKKQQQQTQEFLNGLDEATLPSFEDMER